MARVAAEAAVAEAAAGEVAVRVAGTKAEAGLEAASVVVAAVAGTSATAAAEAAVGRAPGIGSGVSLQRVGSRRTRQRANRPACTSAGITCANTQLARA